MAKIFKTEKSKDLFERAKKSLLGGVASKPHLSPSGKYPIFVDHANGSKIYDVDGNEYIDYLAGFGPMILGYNHSALNRAVEAQIAKGSHFAAPYELLADVSHELVQMIPCANLVTYPSTGTEANMFAVRLARAFTGKDKIIKFEGHYHGRSDELMVSCHSDSLKMMGPRNRPWKNMESAGQWKKALADIIILPWNDLEIITKTIRKHGSEIAAIITEPVMLNSDPVLPQEGYLEGLKQVAEKNEILLIFDEVLTGFRLARGGAQEYYKVIPHIASFGKAVAGGFQLGVVATEREIMETGVHFGGTFNANPTAIAACKATLKELKKPGIYDHMARLTKRLTKGINDIARKKHINLYCRHLSSIWQISFGINEQMIEYRDTFKVNMVDYQRFRKACCEKGIILDPNKGRAFVSAAHTDEDIDKTLSVAEQVFSEMYNK